MFHFSLFLLHTSTLAEPGAWRVSLGSWLSVWRTRDGVSMPRLAPACPTSAPVDNQPLNHLDRYQNRYLPGYQNRQISTKISKQISTMIPNHCHQHVPLLSQLLTIPPYYKISKHISPKIPFKISNQISYHMFHICPSCELTPQPNIKIPSLWPNRYLPRCQHRYLTRYPPKINRMIFTRISHWHSCASATIAKTTGIVEHPCFIVPCSPVALCSQPDLTQCPIRYKTKYPIRYIKLNIQYDI